jgi:hypothetical protein
MHEHPDHVIVFLTDNHTKHTFADGTTKELQSKPGQVVWQACGENLSDQPFDVIEIELKGKATAYAATTRPGSRQ